MIIVATVCNQYASDEYFPRNTATTASDIDDNTFSRWFYDYFLQHKDVLNTSLPVSHSEVMNFNDLKVKQLVVFGVRTKYVYEEVSAVRALDSVMSYHMRARTMLILQIPIGRR